MNEELQGKMVEILTSIQGAAGKASDFALTQLPDIAQSYVMYGRVKTTSAIVVCLIFLALLAVAANYISKKEKTKRYGDAGFPWQVAGLFSLFPICGLTVSSGEFFLVWFAPKVWLLKELASMIK